MNQYTEILYYLKSLGESDPFINTVTKGSPDKLDLETSNIYPLFHIDVSSASFTNTKTITFNVSLACLDQRDINPEVNADKFWSNDNEVDNHNETLASLNRIWSKLYLDVSEKDMTASENPPLDKVDYSGSNILDGWQMTFELEVPNTTINLCT